MSKEELSFEEALRELEEIVQTLESGEISLEKSVLAYERGVFLKKSCEKLLSDAKMRIDAIDPSPESSPSP